MEQLITRKEAAKMLGISAERLDEARRAGTIKYIRYNKNGKIYFTESALEEYVARSTYQVRNTESILTYRRRRKYSGR